MNSKLAQTPLTRRTILENLGAFLAGGMVTRLFSALALFIIARQIGPPAYAQYAPSLATASIAAVAFTLGIDPWLVYKGGQSPEKLQTYGGAAVILRIGVGIVWLVLIIFAQRWLNPDTFPLRLFQWAAIAILLEQVCNSIWSSFKANLRNDLSSAMQAVFHGGFFLLVLLLWQLDVKDPVRYVQARAGSAFVALLFSVLLSRPYLKWDFSSRIMREILRGSSVFAVSNALAVVYARIDVTIVAQFLGKPGSQLYSPASSFITALYVFPLAGYIVALPVFGRIHAESPAKFHRFIWPFIAGTILVSLVGGFIIAAIAQPLILITFGEAYRATSSLLTILAWVFTFKTINFAIAACIVVVGWQSRRIGIQLFVALFNISINLYFIETYGVKGVAWIYVASEALITVGYAFILWRWWRLAR